MSTETAGVSETVWVEDRMQLAVYNPFGEVVKEDWPCDRLEPDVGLCVTLSAGGSDYLVTHTASGYAIDVYGQPPMSKERAREALLAVKDVTDWTASRDELKALGIKAAVTAIIHSVRSGEAADAEILRRSNTGDTNG